MNSSEGKTCLSTKSETAVNFYGLTFEKLDGRTLVPPRVEECMIKLFAFLYNEFECVDDVHFTAILCAKQCAQNYSIVSTG